MSEQNLTPSELAHGSANAASYLKALAHELRMQAICLIGSGEMSVQELERHLGASQSNVSQHLAKLREWNILTCRKVGNSSLYRITDPAALELVKTLQKKFCSVHYENQEKAPSPQTIEEHQVNRLQ